MLYIIYIYIFIIYYFCEPYYNLLQITWDLSGDLFREMMQICFLFFICGRKLPGHYTLTAHNLSPLFFPRQQPQMGFVLMTCKQLVSHS